MVPPIVASQRHSIQKTHGGILGANCRQGLVLCENAVDDTSSSCIFAHRSLSTGDPPGPHLDSNFLYRLLHIQSVVAVLVEMPIVACECCKALHVRKKIQEPPVTLVLHLLQQPLLLSQCSFNLTEPVAEAMLSRSAALSRTNQSPRPNLV